MKFLNVTISDRLSYAKYTKKSLSEQHANHTNPSLPAYSGMLRLRSSPRTSMSFEALWRWRLLQGCVVVGQQKMMKSLSLRQSTTQRLSWRWGWWKFTFRHQVLQNFCFEIFPQKFSRQNFPNIFASKILLSAPGDSETMVYSTKLWKCLANANAECSVNAVCMHMAIGGYFFLLFLKRLTTHFDAVCSHSIQNSTICSFYVKQDELCARLVTFWITRANKFWLALFLHRASAQTFFRVMHSTSQYSSAKLSTHVFWLMLLLTEQRLHNQVSAGEMRGAKFEHKNHSQANHTERPYHHFANKCASSLALYLCTATRNR